MFVPIIKELHVEPTTVCQAECPMCPRTMLGYQTSAKTNKQLTMDDFVNAISDFKWTLAKVLFCGTLGDPVAHPDLDNMVYYLNTLRGDMTIGINTNGALRNALWWKMMAAQLYDPTSYVVFSIDGLEDTNHLYRKNVQWNKVIDNASAFIDAGGNAQWDMLVFKHNEHQVEKAREIATALGFKRFRTKVTSRFSPQFPELEPPTNGVPEIKDTELTCMAKDTQSLYLSAEGLWYPCCYAHHDQILTKNKDWGEPVKKLDDRNWSWPRLYDKLYDKPPKVCSRSCGTTHNSGQWTQEWILN